ncbi:MAG: helix-turn-helix domain-containing protein [Chloroflexi bacterium]|nr:helix-turn-helix domain-containing protein [Chloroflexota bacterium]
MTEQIRLKDLEPAKELTVTRLETLKVISDALRSRILDLLRAEAQTVKQLSATLHMPPKKLYYHVNLMEQHGLIRVVSTRIVSGIIEKQYRATAYLFWFDKEVFASSTPEKNSLPPGIALLFENTKIQLEQSVEDHLLDLAEDAPIQRRLFSAWSMARMTPEQLAVFDQRMTALLEEFFEVEQTPAPVNAQAYRLFLTLFPVRRHPEVQSHDNEVQE